jgi:hypothetical protein
MVLTIALPVSRITARALPAEASTPASFAFFTFPQRRGRGFFEKLPRRVPGANLSIIVHNAALCDGNKSVFIGNSSQLRRKVPQPVCEWPTETAVLQRYPPRTHGRLRETLRGDCWNHPKNSLSAMLYTRLVIGDETVSSTRAFYRWLGRGGMHGYAIVHTIRLLPARLLVAGVSCFSPL